MKEKVIVSKGIIYDQQRRILVVKRSEDAQISPNIWEFPGGKCEYLESLEECVIREIKEETSLNVIIKDVLYTWNDKSDRCRHIIGVNFECEMVGESIIKLTFEHSDFKWVNADEILLLNVTDGLKQDVIKYLL